MAQEGAVPGSLKRASQLTPIQLEDIEGGFRERAISNAQVLLAGPQYRQPSPLGRLRSDVGVEVEA